MKKLKEESTQGKSTLKMVFSNQIEFVSDKSSLGAGKKRKIAFVSGTKDAEEITGGPANLRLFNLRFFQPAVLF